MGHGRRGLRPPLPRKLPELQLQNSALASHLQQRHLWRTLQQAVRQVGQGRGMPRQPGRP